MWIKSIYFDIQLNNKPTVEDGELEWSSITTEVEQATSRDLAGLYAFGIIN